MVHVTIVLLDEGHASTAVGPLEVFRDAGGLWGQLTGEAQDPPFDVHVAAGGGRAVRPGARYVLQADESLEQISRTDLVFVPSCGLNLDAVLEREADVIEFIERQHAAGARIAGVCSGVALLAAAGVLDGKAATTHWALADQYAQRFPAVHWQAESMVTEDDGVYCGGGVYAALDLALYLVEKLSSREIARCCSRALLIDMPRECQTGFAVLPTGARHADDLVKRAQDWIRGHCAEDFRFEALARELGMSPRNFVRRFKQATGLAPVEYLQRMRVRAAKRLLEEDHVTVQEVSSIVGYEDVPFFRELFKRHTGMTPAAYRGRFR